MQCLATNAHSIIVDPATHQIYMPLVISQQPDTCPAPAPKAQGSAAATPKAAGPSGPRVLRVLLFHYGDI